MSNAQPPAPIPAPPAPVLAPPAPVPVAPVAAPPPAPAASALAPVVEAPVVTTPQAPKANPALKTKSTTPKVTLPTAGQQDLDLHRNADGFVAGQELTPEQVAEYERRTRPHGKKVLKPIK